MLSSVIRKIKESRGLGEKDRSRRVGLSGSWSSRGLKSVSEGSGWACGEMQLKDRDLFCSQASLSITRM